MCNAKSMDENINLEKKAYNYQKIIDILISPFEWRYTKLN